MKIYNIEGKIQMLIGNNFDRLLKKEDSDHFKILYEMTPDEFMNDYETEVEFDLKGKVVIAVECGHKQAVKIIGAYYPNETHSAVLKYKGHIAFIDIKNSLNERIELLSKDDECWPQKFDEWFEYSSETHCLNKYKYFNKEYCLKLINTVIQGHAQDLSLEFKAKDIIILQGL